MKDKKLVQKADVLLINDNNMGFLGGERESQLIIINAASRKYRTAVIQPGEFHAEIPNTTFYWRTESLRIKRLIKNPIAFCIYFFKVAALIRKISPRVIHSNSQVSFFMVSLYKRFHLIDRDIHFVHTDRGLYTKYNNFFRWLFQFSFKYLDVLITTTRFNMEQWQMANERKKISVSYKVIGNTAGEIYESIDETRISKNSYLTIGFSGRMCEWKGWDLAEKIACKINEIIPDIHCKMYISCLAEGDQKQTSQLFQRMKTVYGDRFEGKINVPFSEMEQFYYDIDIFILTSWKKSESFGRTIVEAMSRRCAVLTTDAGGSVEVVGDKDTICDSVEEFCANIQEWNTDRKRLGDIKKRNYERVRREYTLEKNVSQYLALYNMFIEMET